MKNEIQAFSAFIWVVITIAVLAGQVPRVAADYEQGDRYATATTAHITSVYCKAWFFVVNRCAVEFRTAGAAEGEAGLESFAEWRFGARPTGGFILMERADMPGHLTTNQALDFNLNRLVTLVLFALSGVAAGIATWVYLARIMDSPG